MDKNDQETTTEKLTRHIWTTYKSRYNEHHRLLIIDKLQKITLTVIAVYILAVSVLIMNPTIIGESKVPLVNIYLIILSIVSLALSLTMGQSDNKIKAIEFNKCARELQRLYNHIIMEKEKNPNYKISDEEDKYNNILDKYTIIHDVIDWQNFTYEKRKLHNKNLLQLWIFHIKHFLITKLIYVSLIVVPIAIGVYIIVK